MVSVTHPGTFTAVYLADACSFLAVVPVLARLRLPERGAVEPAASGPEPGGFRQVLRDKAFTVLTLACLSAAVAALSPGRRLAPDVNRIELPAIATG